MLHEIYHLQVSINIIELNYNGKEMVSRFGGGTLLTRPKSLNDSKLMDKLTGYRNNAVCSKSDLVNDKSCNRIDDANVDLELTERNVLSTLLENNMEIRQAEHVCKSSVQKRKEAFGCQLVEYIASSFNSPIDFISKFLKCMFLGFRNVLQNSINFPACVPILV